MGSSQVANVNVIPITNVGVMKCVSIKDACPWLQHIAMQLQLGQIAGTSVIANTYACQTLIAVSTIGFASISRVPRSSSRQAPCVPVWVDTFRSKCYLTMRK